MSNKCTSLLILTHLLFFTNHVFAQIQITEFMASNATTIADEAGDFDDWVELYNSSDAPIDIANYYISDALTEPLQTRIPSGFPAQTTIPAKSYLLVWFDKEPGQGPLHVNAKLSSSGESILLTAPNGFTTVDSYTFSVQYDDISYGKTTLGTFDFYTVPTPWQANSSTPGLQKALAPSFSKTAGRFSNSVEVSLIPNQISSKIYYTLDGSVPAETDSLYQMPLSLNKTTVVRARAFAPSQIASETVTHTYFVNEQSTFPLISVAFEPASFFDPVQGLYIKFKEDIEVPAHVELFEKNQTDRAFGQDFEVELQGSSSVEQPMKSLEIKAKASYGSATLNYPLFDDVPLNQYTRFVLRNSGQDFTISHFRDVLATSLMRDISDLNVGFKKPNLDMQAYRPANVFFNGNYWGIHNIRERANDHWVEQRFGWAANDFDMVENIGEVKSGSDSLWFVFQRFLTDNSFVSDADFAKIEQEVDVDHYIDYVAHNLYLDNYDWPGNNIRRYRHRSLAGAKWRWLTYDLDFTFGLYQPWGWNTGDPQQDALWRMLNPYTTDMNVPNPNWSTLLFRRMWQNEAFRNRFVNRFADLLNTTFAADRVEERIDDFAALYGPEMNRHLERWYGSSNVFWIWQNNVDVLRRFSYARTDYVRGHVATHLPNSSGYVPLQLSVAPQGGGTIDVSTIQLKSQNFPWTGTYFGNVPVPLVAKAAPGFVFSHWSDPALPKESSINVRLYQATQLVAHFVPINGPNTDYCKSSTTSPWHEWISEVKLNGFAFPSSKELNQAPISTNLVLRKGITQDISVKVAYSYFTEDVYVRAWLDANGNRSFDANEMVFEQKILRPADGTPFSIVQATFDLPSDAISHQCLLRVSMQRGAYADACAYFTHGEVEEYSVQVDAATTNPIQSGNAVPLNVEDLPALWVFPNPTFGHFDVHLKDYIGDEVLLELSTASGKILEKRQLTTLDKTVQQFDASDLESGVYFLKIHAPQKRTQVRKVVVLER